ncbi:periphilin-1-like isoform X2 [Paramormyrops kingsleyae]|uniref:periphilin-1-like isoform X2 n=1 Tax=Paramormyrops kingsleyae TaxID=1676925 RepID=UPI000CD6456D|nr:periphilin-1-like isoform X2 [Paramormyrops kingsleyae]
MDINSNTCVPLTKRRMIKPTICRAVTVIQKYSDPLLVTVAYRRERDMRGMYEPQFHPDRGGPYLRDMSERRPGFGRPDEEYIRGFEYDSPRYPNGAPRSYHSDDQRSYYGENSHFASERRSGPLRREDTYQYYRDARDELHGARQPEFRDHRDGLRRKTMFPPQRERSPFRKDVPHSPHSRSGSSLSSRSYSPERSKSYSYQTQQRKNKERPLAYPVNTSRDGSPQSSCSAPKVGSDKAGRAPEASSVGPPPEKAEQPLEPDGTEPHAEFEDERLPEGEQNEALVGKDTITAASSNYAERRSEAIAAKAREIEKVYRQDCETFGMVVKMLVAKEPSLEKQLQNPLKENLCEIRERCLEDLKHFIFELDEAVLRS